MTLPQKRLRDNLDSLKSFEVAYKKKSAVTHTPREALAEIMAGTLAQSQLSIGKAGMLSKPNTRKESAVIKITGQANPTRAILLPRDQEADKENQQPGN